MKRTTIFAEDYLMRELKEISKEENKSVAGVIREAMERYVRQKRRSKRKLSFIGISNSGKKNIAEKHEDLLWKEAPK
jgi:metal-responsive CopG/Arc/MetJ family transcriptional regulator